MKTEIGVQTYTFRNFSIEETIGKLAALDVQALEIFPKLHCPIDSTVSRLEEIKTLMADHGMRACGAGVVNITSDRKMTEMILEYARIMNLDYLSIYPDDPKDRETLAHLVDGAQKAGILLGIHNHGPMDQFYKYPEDLLATVKDYPEIFGACMDTGHFIRVGRSPLDAVAILGKRIHALHIKDYIDEETEVEPGTGHLSIPELFQALKKHSSFKSAFTIEYEANPDDPIPSLKTVVARVRQALEA